MEGIEMIKKYGELPNIDLNNRRRLVRHLEKLENDSVPLDKKNEAMYDFKIIGLTTSREDLYRIIDNRVDKMITDGLIEEVKDLYEQGINTIPVNTAIGYKELYKYFKGEISLGSAIELIKRNSRRYAKRQYTFFKHQFNNIKWLDVNFYNFNETYQEALDYFKGEND